MARAADAKRRVYRRNCDIKNSLSHILDTTVWHGCECAGMALQINNNCRNCDISIVFYKIRRIIVVGGVNDEQIC